MTCNVLNIYFAVLATNKFAVVSLELGYMNWVGDFVFAFNLFPFSPLQTATCSSDGFHYPHSGRIA